MTSLRFRTFGSTVVVGVLVGTLAISCTPSSNTSTTDNTGGAGGRDDTTVTTSTQGQGGSGATGGAGGDGAAGGQGGSGGAPVMSLCPPDADGDDISDAVEGNGAVDTDGDG